MGQEQEQFPHPDSKVGGLSFEPLREFGPFTDNEPSAVVARAVAIWFATTLLGGAALTAAIDTVASRVHAPGFAELEYLGFLMGGVVGLLLAVGFFVKALYRPQ